MSLRTARRFAGRALRTGLLAAALLTGCGRSATRPDPAATYHLLGQIAPPEGNWVRWVRSISPVPGGDLYLLIDGRESFSLRQFSADGVLIRTIPWQWPNCAASSWCLIGLDPGAHRIHVYDLEGQPRYDFPFDAADSPESNSFDCTVAETGRICVLDRNLRRVHCFSATGHFEASWGERGTGAGQWEVPAAIAMDTDGRIYVLDIDQWRIHRFAPDGQLLHSWDIPRSVEFGALLDGTMAVDGGGNPVILDNTYHPGRVTFFGPTPETSRSWEISDLGPSNRVDPAMPPIAFGRQGHLLCQGELGIEEIAREGVRLGVLIHYYGTRPGEFSDLSRALFRDEQELLVGDDNQRGLIRFDTSGRFLGPLELAPERLSRTPRWGTGGTLWALEQGGMVGHFSPTGARLGQWPIPFTTKTASAYDLAETPEGLAIITYDRESSESILLVCSRRGELIAARTLSSVVTSQITPAGGNRLWLFDQRAGGAWQADLERISDADFLSPIDVSLGNVLQFDSDRTGRLFVLSEDPPRVVVYDRNGHLLTEFGEPELAEAGFDARRSRVFLAASPAGKVAVGVGSDRVLIFAP